MTKQVTITMPTYKFVKMEAARPKDINRSEFIEELIDIWLEKKQRVGPYLSLAIVIKQYLRGEHIWMTSKLAMEI